MKEMSTVSLKISLLLLKPEMQKAVALSPKRISAMPIALHFYGG
ncbi:hypothetical protein C427_0881 [Paraglaciecola psychrophila 170]|jgi:hypothetical protein|uniref:Uncharacterized protein n=1 Tax=Paraglaciecola psychrophila 170 TaxID=1129794 RepID=K6ZSW4_9ALTE|nr:hypothetical protein C427_0881 [Paraglaciecola psychrophila 170]GAC39021.1 hypothetical protein GPSY_3410 [Paraglaciecola psychrophila 170]